MSIPYERALAIFRQLGVKDAEAWAKGESEDDEPALVRFLFLKALWDNVVGDDDAWMKEWADPKHPIPAAIQRMLGKGIDPDDLTDVVRDMQIDVLFNACVSLSDSSHGVEELQKNIPEAIDWCLAEHDVANAKAGRIAGTDIHGEFYDFDPTGRRGEPRKRRTATKIATATKKATATRKATATKKSPAKRSSRNAKRNVR